MKIAIIVRRLNVRGGTQRYAVMLARTLRERGHNVTLYTYVLNRAECYAELLRDTPIVALRDESEKRTGSDLPQRLKGVSALNRENHLARELALKIASDTDIINPHDQEVFRVPHYFKHRVRDVPSVWTMNDMPTRYASFLRAREVNPGMKASPLKRLKWFLFDTYLIRRFISGLNAITVLDQRDAEWVKRFFGMSALVIRTGADVKNATRAARESPHGHIVLLTAGIFFPHRRFEDIVEAVSILRGEGRDVALRIVGDESSDKEYAARVRARAHELGTAEYITFLGRVSEDALQSEYENAHCFVFAAHMQSWGIAVFEAMGAGLPAIVSRTSGASEVLTDGVNALLVEPKNPTAIARAVRSLIENADQYRKLSTTSANFVRTKITWERTAEEMETLFNNLLRERPNRTTIDRP